MANSIKIKRSAVPGKVPTTGDLDLGELGLNTFDGKLFTKKDDGEQTIVEIGGGTEGGGTASPSGPAGSIQITDPDDDSQLGNVEGFRWNSPENVLEIPGDVRLNSDSEFEVIWDQEELTENITITTPNKSGTIVLRDGLAFVDLASGFTGTTDGFTEETGTAVLSESTFTGATGTKAYTISDVVRALKQVGLLEV
jgi:hypothetical protein